MGPLSIVVIQPTSFCNLDCAYCYVPGRTEKQLMSDEILEAAFQCAFSSGFLGDEVEILYHAGEPLAAGLPFYQRAVEFAQKANLNGLKVTHSIQTNGTMVTPAWARFFAEHQFEIGISLDGPSFIHDVNRVTRSGRGSHEAALRGLLLLQDAGLYVGAVCVLSTLSLSHPDEIFDFFVDHGVPSVGFNIEETENYHKESAFLRATGDWEEIYSQFVARIYQRHLDHPSLRIREFIDVFDTASRLRANPFYFRRPVEARDLGMITINKAGKVTTYCPEFAGSKSLEYNDFVIGDVREQTLREMIEGDAFKKLSLAIHESQKLCAKSCSFFEFCGGSHFSNKYSEFGRLDVSETASCRLHRQVLTRALLTGFHQSADPIEVSSPT